MRETTCVRVGYGTVSHIHQQKMRECGVETIGVVELDKHKRLNAKINGFSVFTSCEEAAKLQPTFWDICVSTHQHFRVIQSILNFAPEANIIIEKPVCLFSEISSLREVLLSFKGKIVVNENYASSTIKNMMWKIAIKNLDIVPEKIVVEFTKNRKLDFAKGRFIDHSLGALGYEGSHMIALASSFLEDYAPDKILETKFSDIIFRDLNKYLYHQGSADIRYKSYSGSEIEMYTSMVGNIKYKYPLFVTNNIPQEDQKTKYRIIAVHGRDCKNEKHSVIGLLEPINCFNRCQGVVYTIQNGKIQNVFAPVDDDTMKSHFQEILRYFKGEIENPYSVEKGIKVVEILHQLTEQIRSNKSSQNDVVFDKNYATLS